MKESADIFAEYLYSTINVSLKSSRFLSFLKVAYTTPIHKKAQKDMKEN